MPTALAVLLSLLLVGCSGAAEVKSIDLTPACPVVPRGPGVFEFGLDFGNPSGKASKKLIKRRPERRSREESPCCLRKWQKARILLSSSQKLHILASFVPGSPMRGARVDFHRLD